MFFDSSCCGFCRTTSTIISTTHRTTTSYRRCFICLASCCPLSIIQPFRIMMVFGWLWWWLRSVKKKNCDRQFRKLIYGLAGKVLNNLSATIMINNNGSRCYYEEIILLQSNEAMILDSDFTDRESVPMFFSSFILDWNFLSFSSMMIYSFTSQTKHLYRWWLIRRFFGLAKLSNKINSFLLCLCLCFRESRVFCSS